MPPKKSRARVTKPDVEDEIEPADLAATPSRKRRRLNGAENTKGSPVPAAIQASRTVPRAISPASNTTTDEASEPLDHDEAIQNLKVARYTTWAAYELSNDLQTSRETQAYAKITGRDWHYMVRDSTTVHIGRADRPSPDTTVQLDAPGIGAQTQWQDSNHLINIDLGPSKEVSRVHALLHWDPNISQWMMHVNGRNGLKCDGAQIAKGEVFSMRSGMVISILGTEMMWEQPGQQPEIADYYLYPSRASERSPSTDEETKRRRRNQKGFSDDRQFTDQDPFPPSSTKRNKHVEHDRRPPSSVPNSSFVNAAFPGGHLPATPSGSRRDLYGASPGYPRGVMLETTEDIDYKSDTAKDLKPPHSYAQLIGHAILSSDEEQLTLANIYAHIAENYAYYRHAGPGWQNSIRHNLSLSKSFEKVARRTDEPGKGMKWKIVDAERDSFLKKILAGPRKGTAMHRNSSGPSSPAAGMASIAGERLMDITGRNIHRSPTFRDTGKAGTDSLTPPQARYPTANEAFTPDRGSRPNQMPPLANGVATHTPVRPSFGGAIKHANQDKDRNGNVGSSRELLSDGANNSPSAPFTDQKHFGAPLFTPMVARHAQALVPPSTQQRMPSFFANLSSPAPFWKLDEATPYRANDPFSPLKRERRDSEGEVKSEEKDDVGQPSSPPLVRENEDADDDEGEDAAVTDLKLPEPSSPTRSVSRPQSRRRDTFSQTAGRERATSTGDTLQNGGPVSNVTDSASTIQRSFTPHASFGNANGNSNHPPVSSAPVAGVAPRAPVGLGMSFGSRTTGAPKHVAADDSDEEIDLTKGFQAIGSFHQSLSQTHSHGYGGAEVTERSHHPAAFLDVIRDTLRIARDTQQAYYQAFDGLSNSRLGFADEHLQGESTPTQFHKSGSSFSRLYSDFIVKSET